MERLLLDIQERLAGNMEDISLIDEDYGQLDAEDDVYPVTFPCVLLSIANVEWSNIAGNSQKGTATVAVRLVIDCYHDTHYGSTQETRMEERVMMYKAMHSALQGFRCGTAGGCLNRVASRFYTVRGGVKVYESEYTVSVSDIQAGSTSHAHFSLS